MGYRKFVACAVTSNVPAPAVSPCGICRQVLREFLPLSAPIIMLSSTYKHDSTTPPPSLADALSDKGLLEDKSVSPKNSDWEKEVKIMTLEELLPMSFGPEHLDMTV